MAALVLALDIASKVWVVATLADGHSIKLFNGLVYFSLTRNTGAAFSLASGFTVILSLVAVVIVVVIVRLARRLSSMWWSVSLGLILGGALGNLADRIFRAPGIFRGGVVDFISLLNPTRPPWPIFNLADSALTLGVVLAVLLELLGHHITHTVGQGGAAENTQGSPAAPIDEQNGSSHG